MTPAAEKSVVILGATSGVARPMADRFARDGFALVLAGRNADELNALAADLRIRRQVPCHALVFDALAFDDHPGFPERCAERLGHLPEGVVVCFGTLADQVEAQASFPRARLMLDTNLTGAVSILERFAEAFEKRGHGFIAALTSVAGDRGRKSNYLYGASKAGLAVYLQGLRNRLHGAGVRVTTLKPGFMDTPMIQGMPLPRKLVANPESAAASMVRAIQQGKSVVYIPSYWRTIMLLIRSIPEFLFKRMNL